MFSGKSYLRKYNENFDVLKAKIHELKRVSPHHSLVKSLSFMKK